MNDIGAQAREVSQAMTKRVDKVEQQMECVHSSQREEPHSAVEYRILGLKNEFCAK